MEKIYLDVCCLNRPFDDQSQDRIRLETRAVNIILGGIEEKRFLWYGSEIVYDEVLNTPDHVKKNDMLSLCEDISEYINLTEDVVERGIAITQMGFTSFDAMHIALSESAKVDVFLTTDDKLLKKAKRLADKINVNVKNPVLWIEEEINKW